MAVVFHREKQEYAQLESQIDGLSSTKDTLEQQLTQLAGNAGKHDEMLLISERLAALVVDIDNRTERWLELADRAEQHTSVSGQARYMGSCTQLET